MPEDLQATDEERTISDASGLYYLSQSAYLPVPELPAF